MNYEEIKKFKTKKSEFGLCKYDDRICFFKKSDERLKYNILKKYYKVPKLLDKYNNTLIYEYIPSMINNTIHEYLYLGGNYFKGDIIFNQYKEALNSICLMNEDMLENRKYFKGRINLLKKYIDLGLFTSDVNKIINDVIYYIDLNKKLYAFISNGDPTDTNISLDGYFCDYECAGYNSIVGEITIFTVSILSHGMYFYPKYNSDAYKIRPYILNHFNDYKPSYKIKLPLKNKEVLLKYLDFYNKNLNILEKENVNKYLKYYIIMRLLTPIDVSKMDLDDKRVIIIYVTKFININSLDELIQFILNC